MNSNAACGSGGAGGGGFGQAGTNAGSCLAGNGGDGYELPFAPIMPEYVAGGGAGGLTCYSICPNPMFGKDGSGQNGYGGGGRAGCGYGQDAPPVSICNAQAGRAGAVFISFNFICPAGTRQVVHSGWFSGSPCEAVNATFPPPSTSLPPLVPSSIAPFTPASLIPSYISAAAVATSGHMPRALELVQFLSIYCTSLSSQQQTRISEFQVASFTHIAMSKAGDCHVCPGFCTSPLVLVLPTFTLVGCLVTLSVLVLAHDAYKACNTDRFATLMQGRLLEASDEPSAAAADGRSSLLRVIASFCVRYLRGLIETASAYVVIPCTFVFVLNLRPSSFAQADASDRAMIVILPVLTLLLRALVVCQRVVPLTPADQKQLYVCSLCSCCIAAVLSVQFNLASGDGRSSSPSFATELRPQYIVLALLVVQIIAQSVIRLRATEASIFDNTDWPWSPARSTTTSAVFSFDELPTRMVLGSIRGASSSAATSVAKFIVLNYVALSQMSMVVAGLASAGATSAVGVETSSIVIGIIPLISSGALLLFNVVKFMLFLRQKWLKKQNDAGSFSSRSHSNVRL